MKKLKYLLAGVLVSAVAGCFVACDDDESATDEWTADYVYLERLKLGIGSLEFNQTHSSLGIAGDTEVSMPFAVCLAKPWKSDVAVKFAYTIEGDMPEEIVTFREGGAVVIPAGELVARDTMDLRTDWSFCSAGGCHLQSDGRDRIGAACFRTIAYFFETEGAVRSDKQSQIHGYTGRRETFGQPDCGLQRLVGLCYQCG